MIKILTDSVASIPADVAREAGIDVVTLFVNRDGTEYADASMDLDVFYADIYDMVDNIPTSSQPSQHTLETVFEEAARAGDEVLGIFISTLGSRSFTKFNSLLIGDILSVEPGKIGLLALILLLVLALWGLSFNHLMLSAVHPALADSRGVRVFWQEALFSAAIAVVVTVSMTWVGLLVINSLLVLPAAAARNISRNMFQYHLCSLLFAVGAGIAGLMTSYYIGSSAGASITLYLAGIFLVTFLLRKRG